MNHPSAPPCCNYTSLSPHIQNVVILSRTQLPVRQLHYMERATSNYVRSAVEAAVEIHREDLPGDILIFLTGEKLTCSHVAGMALSTAQRFAAH